MSKTEKPEEQPEDKTKTMPSNPPTLTPEETDGALPYNDGNSHNSLKETFLKIRSHMLRACIVSCSIIGAIAITCLVFLLIVYFNQKGNATDIVITIVLGVCLIVSLALISLIILPFALKKMSLKLMENGSFDEINFRE